LCCAACALSSSKAANARNKEQPTLCTEVTNWLEVRVIRQAGQMNNSVFDEIGMYSSSLEKNMMIRQRP